VEPEPNALAPVGSRTKVLLGAIIVALLIAGMLGAQHHLRAVHRSTRQTMCVHNLKFLSASLKAYADDHGGRFPDRLAELWPEYIVNLQDLICPEVQVICRRKYGVPHPYPEDPNPDTIERLSSYIYVPGYTTEDPADTVVAYEKEDNHFGRGRSLLYLDGRGAWEPPENWENGPPNTTLPPDF